MIARCAPLPSCLPQAVNVAVSAAAFLYLTVATTGYAALGE